MLYAVFKNHSDLCMNISLFQEAKQAIELMGRWEMIDVCDALELLSPVFESEDVRIEYVIYDFF